MPTLSHRPVYGMGCARGMKAATTGGAGLLERNNRCNKRAFLWRCDSCWGCCRHHDPVVGADIPDANVIGHDPDTVRPWQRLR